MSYIRAQIATVVPQGWARPSPAVPWVRTKQPQHMSTLCARPCDLSPLGAEPQSLVEEFCKGFGAEMLQEEAFRLREAGQGGSRSPAKCGCRESPLTRPHGEYWQVNGTTALFSLVARGPGCCSPMSASRQLWVPPPRRWDLTPHAVLGGDSQVASSFELLAAEPHGSWGTVRSTGLGSSSICGHN